MTTINNNTSASKRSTSFTFTINNWAPEDRPLLEQLGARYLVYGEEEAPDTGTPHLQGYVSFKNARTLRSLSKKMPRAHIEIAYASAAQNREYCTKNGTNIYEEGDMPQKNGGDTIQERIATNKRLISASVKELIDSGDIHVRDAKRIRDAQYVYRQCGDPTETDDVRGVWIYGPPGVGKSYKARTQYTQGGLYIKAQNKWFDGYQGEANILIEDLDNDCLHHYLKIWADKYTCSGEVKGGTIPLRHQHLIVTSNYTIHELHYDPKHTAKTYTIVKALERRFKVIRIPELFTRSKQPSHPADDDISSREDYGHRSIIEHVD